jgi:alpha-glucosidase
VLAFRRESSDGGEAFVCVANTTGADVRVRVPAAGRVLLTSAAVPDPAAGIASAGGEALVPADTTVWFTV